MAYFWLLLRNVGGRRKDGRKAKTLRNPARGSRLSRFGFENAEKSLAGLATGGPFPPDALAVRVRNHHRHRCGFSIAESESVSKQQQQQRKKSEETKGNVSTPAGPECCVYARSYFQSEFPGYAQWGVQMSCGLDGYGVVYSHRELSFPSVETGASFVASLGVGKAALELFHRYEMKNEF